MNDMPWYHVKYQYLATGTSGDKRDYGKVQASSAHEACEIVAARVFKKGTKAHSFMLGCLYARVVTVKAPRKGNAPKVPNTATLCKLGSIVRHTQELLSPGGHEVDRIALSNLLDDADVVHWLEDMDAAALLPVMRNSTRARDE